MTSGNKLIVTALAEDRLVWREAVNALRRAGYMVEPRKEETLSSGNLARMLALPPERSGLDKHPDLFFSINFHGLDKFGENVAVLRGKGIPVAVWCVDNPWNLLSGLRTDFWKELFLFVTDPGFIPGLVAHGARRAFFLPLATDPGIFCPGGPSRHGATQHGSEGAPLAFVGRSAFPDKERFFVGQHVPEGLLEEAKSRLRAGKRADFFWWLKALERESAVTPLWPGSAARRASLGAEESSLAWRAACLHEAASVGLTMYGDAGWAEHFPPDDACGSAPKLCPPLDYYTQLPAVYANAPFSLNLMSFLLPHGLNQRHFDVWAAGGFCLMDDCPGLDLFPPELTRPVMFGKPTDIPERVAYFEKNSEEKHRLAAAWREHILREHTYAVRMREMMRILFE